MNRWFKTACAIVLSVPLVSQAAIFSTDFNSGLPPGTSVSGSAFADSGVLKLTINANGQQGNFFIPDFTDGNAITNFKASFNLALGGGTCCGSRMADGLSIVLGASDLTPGSVYAEEGFGNGITVTFDTWDNASPDTAPAIDVRVGGSVIAFQSMGTLGGALRDTGRAPDGPVLMNSLGEEVQIFTYGPAPANPAYVPVTMELFADNTFSLSFSNVVVWDHLALPYTPVSGANWGFGARTGGANENAWVDDLEIFADFTAGPVTITSQPSDQTVTESQMASFSIQLDGTPPYSIQWFSNDVAIAGANGPTYTTPPTTTGMSGTIYRAEVTNELSGGVAAVSGNAMLTVNAGVFAQSASTGGRTNQVLVRFSKDVSLFGDYTLDNGVTINSVSYGATHRDVILDTSILTADTDYTLTILGETGEDGSALIPDPSFVTFHEGFGAFCTDFTMLPNGAALYNNGTSGSGVLGDDGTGNMVVHLTDDGITGAYGKLFIANRTGGGVLKELQAKWQTRIGGDLGGHADGMSFNWASNLAADGNFIASEEGEGTGVSFTIDTWDGGSGPDTGIEIKWQGTRIAFQHIPRTDEGDGNFLCKDVFVDTSASVNSAGLATFSYNGNMISATIPGWAGIVNGAFDFAARTGGEDDNMWIDDVCINNFTLGPVFFTLEPVETTALEAQGVTFTAAVDGSPAFYFQWLSNNVPIAGANLSSYTTPPTTAANEGDLYSVVSSNDFSSVTSSNAVLHVKLSPRVLTVFSRGETDVHVVYTRAVDINSGSYEFDNGGFEQDRHYGTNHNEVIIVTDAPLAPNVTYTLTIGDVGDEADVLNLIFPNPTIVTFHHGYGSVISDFELGPPAGASIFGSAAVLDGYLHLTDAVNSENGVFFLPDINGGAPTDRLLVRFKTQIGAGTCCDPSRWADGLSFNVASDITSASTYGEDGAGSGLTISFDTWDNDGVDTAPAIEVRYKGITVATQSMAGVREPNRGVNAVPVTPLKNDVNDNPLSLDTSNQFVNVLLSVSPSGKLDLYFKDVSIFHDLQLPNYTPFVNANYGFGARTGGANENAWIDDLSINAFSLGGLTITGEPADVTTARRASFSVDVDGLPPYAVQWYSNSVPIAGATTLSYITPVLSQSANGAGYFAVIGNDFSSVTSRVAMVTVTSTSVALSIVRNGDGSATISWPGTGFTLQATDELKADPAQTVWQDQPFISPTVIPPGFFGTGKTNVFFRLIGP